jgi:hypothetical protein
LGRPIDVPHGSTPGYAEEIEQIEDKSCDFSNYRDEINGDDDPAASTTPTARTIPEPPERDMTASRDARTPHQAPHEIKFKRAHDAGNGSNQSDRVKADLLASAPAVEKLGSERCWFSV